MSTFKLRQKSYGRRNKQTEHNIQVSFIRWCDFRDPRFPGIERMYAIPNGFVADNPRHVVKMKAEGLRPGVPDCCLPIPKNGHGALYIEFKSPGQRLNPKQRDWKAFLESVGNKHVVCFTVNEAIEEVRKYYYGA